MSHLPSTFVEVSSGMDTMTMPAPDQTYFIKNCSIITYLGMVDSVSGGNKIIDGSSHHRCVLAVIIKPTITVWHR